MDDDSQKMMDVVELKTEDDGFQVEYEVLSLSFLKVMK